MKNELAQTQDNTIAIRQETENLIRAGVAENTIKAYQRAYDGFSAWLLDNVTTLSDNTLSAYITQLHVDGKSPATISIVVAAVRWWLKNENNAIELPITTRTLAGIRREGKERGRGQVKGMDWQVTERVCAFAESDKTIADLRDSAMIRLRKMNPSQRKFHLPPIRHQYHRPIVRHPTTRIRVQ